MVVAPNTEGVPFVILQSSFEDAQDVLAMQNIGLGKNIPSSLLTKKAFQAVTMVDFWNSVYSWLRGVLFLYFPSETTYLQDRNTYDLEANFVPPSELRSSPILMAVPNTTFSSFTMELLRWLTPRQESGLISAVCRNVLKHQTASWTT